MILSKHLSRKSTRSGTTVVELAVILPVFFTFLFAIFEFGYGYMIINSLNAAAKKAARYGVVDGITTAQVTQRVDELLSQAFDSSKATVIVKDASAFDVPGVDPSAIDYAGLPAVALDEMDARQLFIVRIEVPYEEVAILPPLWVKGVTLHGQSVMRHE